MGPLGSYLAPNSMTLAVMTAKLMKLFNDGVLSRSDYSRWLSYYTRQLQGSVN